MGKQPDVVERVTQEFYCASSGGGCGGFVLVPINMSINHIVEVVCPKCGHKHKRMVKNGVLTEQGRDDHAPTEELCPTLAAWSKKARHPLSKKRVGKWDQEREAVIVDPFLDDLKMELLGDRL